MTERLTKKWTQTAEEAFGESGAKGLIGEQFVANTISSWGWSVELHETDKASQISGVDITFQNPKWAKAYTADIKTNLDVYGNFYVECTDKGWLFNPKKTSDRIWHCNPETGWMAWYDREAMKNHVESKGLRGDNLYKVTVKANIDFVTRRKSNIMENQNV